MKLFHKIYGNGGRPIIILHGLFGMLDNWHRIANALSDEFRVITVDQRNHGHSPHSDEMNYQLMSEDLRELMDDLELENAIIVGHSMGGKTVMTFSDMFPERVDKLVVVDIAPKTYMPGHRLYFEALKALDFEEIKNRKEAEMQLEEYESNFAIRQFLLKNMVRNPEGGYMLKMNLEGIERAYPEIIGTVDFQKRFFGSVLFIKGEKSRYIQDQDWINILDRYPNSELVSIANSGHWVHAENHEDFVKSLREFASF
jgi:esterase